MNIEIEVTGINAVYPHNKNAIIIGIDVEDTEGFAHSLFNGMEDTKEFNIFRDVCIKKCIDAYLDCASTAEKENLKEYFEEKFDFKGFNLILMG